VPDGSVTIVRSVRDHRHRWHTGRVDYGRLPETRPDRVTLVFDGY
jgi:hypothetical protein